MIKFYQKRFIFMIISGLIFLAGIVAIFVNGIQLDIQFKGGSILKYDLVGEVDTEKADSITSQTLSRLASCQILTETATNKNYLVINLAGNEGLSSDQQLKLDTALKQAFPSSELNLYETNIVEPFIGEQFLKNGLIAIVLSFIAIILYVWYRFKKIGGLSAGLMALLALVHDCFVVFFVFIIFRIPLNENFIAATLTIIGFSVNDTIVIYDRIRENVTFAGRKYSIEELVDKSISQSLTRSINTNAAVFISILIVCIFAWIFGISSILSFALPMTFGVVSGCYSTICIAGPFWVMWKKHEEKAKLSKKA